MSKRRMIDPAFWESENIAKLNLQQRYLFIGLFSNADDQGRLKGHPALIRNAVFPFDEISFEQIKSDLQAIANIGSIILYEVDGKDYIQIVGWWDYQKLQWAYPSDIPAPNGWNDRLRYRSDNEIIKSNWGGERDNDDDNGNQPEPRPGPETQPTNGQSLPNALPKSLGKPPELVLELELDNQEDEENARAEFWTVYQTEIGAISPLIADLFNDYFGKVPIAWMVDSVGIAVENNKRKASYVCGCIDKAIAAKKPPRLVFENKNGANNGHQQSKHGTNGNQATQPERKRTGGAADRARAIAQRSR